MAPTYAEGRTKMELRNAALAANAAELSHLEPKRLQLDQLLTEVKSLTAEQANLTAKKQEVSKRIAKLLQEGSTLVHFLDLGIKQHFGNRAEKLVEFGLQPFRSRPRLILVGPDGKRLKKPVPATQEPPEDKPVTSPPASS